MLQLETFSPHEPFFTPRHYKDLYPHDYKGPLFDWPIYQSQSLTETPEQVAHCRLDPGATVESVHRLVDDLERIIRDRKPDIARIVIHAEPKR